MLLALVDFIQESRLFEISPAAHTFAFVLWNTSLDVELYTKTLPFFSPFFPRHESRYFEKDTDAIYMLQN
jgi:hypothetical protein